MRWAAKDYTQWHSYRPLLPVKIKDQWVWLERVLRRGRLQKNISGRTKYSWEYINSEFDLLNDRAASGQGILAGQVLASNSNPGGLFPDSGKYVSRASHQSALEQLVQKRAGNTQGTL